MPKSKPTTAHTYQASPWYQALSPEDQARAARELDAAPPGRRGPRIRVYARWKRRSSFDQARELDWFLRKRYNISIADYHSLLDAQGGVCAICGRTQGSTRAPRLFVDHDHATGRVRGLLCSICNHLLMKMGDDLEGVMRFVTYLRKPRG